MNEGEAPPPGRCYIGAAPAPRPPALAGLRGAAGSAGPAPGAAPRSSRSAPLRTPPDPNRAGIYSYRFGIYIDFLNYSPVGTRPPEGPPPRTHPHRSVRCSPRPPLFVPHRPTDRSPPSGRMEPQPGARSCSRGAAPCDPLPAERPVHLCIHTTTGARYEVAVPPDETVEGLKRRLSQRLKVPKERLALLHKDRYGVPPPPLPLRGPNSSEGWGGREGGRAGVGLREAPRCPRRGRSVGGGARPCPRGSVRRRALPFVLRSTSAARPQHRPPPLPLLPSHPPPPPHPYSFSTSSRGRQLGGAAGRGGEGESFV